MRKRKIMTTLAALAIGVSMAGSPAGSCVKNSCTNGTCITVSASDKCSSKKSSCTKNKCSKKTNCRRILADLLKQYTCKTCR